MKYGIMGGTFDPIHLGHLFIAQEIFEQLDLDKILFIPNGTPPHKKASVSEEDRLEMVENALSDNPNFEVSDIELFKKEKSYTVDTLTELKEKDPDSDIYFIIGSDSVLSIDTWKNYEEIFELCTIVCYERPGFNVDDINISEKLRGKIIFIDSILLEISSTDIRNRVFTNKSIKYLVRESTEKFIKMRNLYRRAYDR